MTDDQRAMAGTPTGRLLVGATGAISVIDLPQYLGVLRTFVADLRVVLTPMAARMLPTATLGHLCQVHDDTSTTHSHVTLARSADLFMVLPCTANTLGLLANGLAPNLLTTTALACTEPLMIFPIMNQNMWERPSVQRNVSLLEGDGNIVVPPRQTAVYEVASGSTKQGCGLLAPIEVGKLVHAQLSARLATEHGNNTTSTAAASRGTKLPEQRSQLQSDRASDASGP